MGLGLSVSPNIIHIVFQVNIVFVAAILKYYTHNEGINVEFSLN